MNKRIKITLLGCLIAASIQGGWAQESSPQPTTKIERRQQADQEMEKARELLKQGYYDSAVVKYQEAFKIAPNYTKPYEELGKLMMDKRNFAYAIQMYSKLGELEPRNPEYRKVLFSLYDSYEAPNEALKSGEVLLDLGKADDATVKRMAELYGSVDKVKDKARMMDLYATRTDADAEYWSEVAAAYTAAGQPRKAELAINQSLEKEPKSVKYRNQLGRIYMEQGNLKRAEEVFEELKAENPNDPGVKDELARLYAQQGDEYLVRGRGNTALEYYDKAEATGQVEGDDSKTIVGTYTGTVNTTNQIFNTQSSSPGVGIGTYRRGSSGFAKLGGSLAERRSAAQQLLEPQYIFDGDFGNQDVNSYTLIDNVVRVPIRGTELDLRVRHSYRDSSSFAGSASREYIYAGANYNWNKNWSTQAYVGSQGLYDVTTLYEGDNFRGGVLFQRDVWAFTPRALGTDLYFNRQGAFGGVSIGDRWSIDGRVDLYQFNDGVDQTIWSIGPGYQLILEPGVQELQVSYVHSGVTNSRTIDPIVRFSPGNLQADSVGMEYNRVLTDWWRVRGAYYHTWVNDGTNLGSWNVGSDFQLWKGAWLGLEYERGNFGRGVLTPNAQSIRTKNDNLNVNFGVTF